jgi:hypothetical protein
MLDWLRYRRELSQLKKQNSKDIAPLQTAYWDAKEQNKSQAEIDYLLKEMSRQGRANRDQIALLQTDYLISIAEKRLLPIPERPSGPLFGVEDTTGLWRGSAHSQEILTKKGMRELRLTIRSDRRERLEIFRSWLTGLTGLIGVLIGLLAVILGKR